MMVFLNGRFLPVGEARVSALDRGFLYGDGIFETLRVVDGRPFLAAEHLRRFRAGAAFLGIPLAWSDAELAGVWQELFRLNHARDGVLRMTLSRGPGPRGYSPRGAGPPTLLVTLHPAPPATGAPAGWRVVTSRIRGTGPRMLAPYKVCNRLPQILARADADAAGADEALILDEAGRVVEGASANVFWVRGDELWSPGPHEGALDGITRRWVADQCRKLGWTVREGTLPLEQVRDAEGLFFTLSSLGPVEACELDGRPLPRWPGFAELRSAYEAALRTR